MKRDDVIHLLRKLETPLRAEGVAHVSLFGSRARGDERADSDIDLLIEIDPEARFSVLNLVGIEHIVSDASGLSANAFMRRSLEEGFRDAIASDIVNVF
jgi:uncharacterized protein